MGVLDSRACLDGRTGPRSNRHAVLAAERHPVHLASGRRHHRARPVAGRRGRDLGRPRAAFRGSLDEGPVRVALRGCHQAAADRGRSVGARPEGVARKPQHRRAVREAGYADHCLHPTAPSIGKEVPGNGANIDTLETQDGRRLLPHTGSSIEPGIYLPGEFGIRSEVDVYLTETDALVTGVPIQTAIVPILAM